MGKVGAFRVFLFGATFFAFLEVFVLLQVLFERWKISLVFFFTVGVLSKHFDYPQHFGLVWRLLFFFIGVYIFMNRSHTEVSSSNLHHLRNFGEELSMELKHIRAYDGSSLIGKRWEKIDPKTQEEFLIDKSMKVFGGYFIVQNGETGSGNIPPKLRKFVKMADAQRIWEKEGVDLMISLNDQKIFNETTPPHYPGGSKTLWQALETHATYKYSQVAVIGSISPWVEAVILSVGIHSVHTVDYNIPISEDKRIKIFPIHAITQHRDYYDYIVSYSSIEHDGLGRYGDPISPNGDRAAMIEMWFMLKRNGLLFLNVPCIDKDALAYNQNRIYGPKRMDFLIDGLFEPVKVYIYSRLSTKMKSMSYAKIWKSKEIVTRFDPVFVFRKVSI